MKNTFSSGIWLLLFVLFVGLMALGIAVRNQGKTLSEINAAYTAGGISDEKMDLNLFVWDGKKAFSVVGVERKFGSLNLRLEADHLMPKHVAEFYVNRYRLFVGDRAYLTQQYENLQKRIYGPEKKPVEKPVPAKAVPVNSGS